MLTPSKVDELAARLAGGHQEAMCRRVLDQLVTALVADGELTVRDMRTLELAAKLNREAVMTILAEERLRIDEQTRSVVARALQESDDDDVAVLRAAYPAAIIHPAIAPVGTVTAAVSQIIARENLRMTLRAQAVWYDVAAEAITGYSAGADTLGTVMARAVGRLSREGLTTVEYRSGMVSDIDVAIRRAAVTFVSQAAARNSEARMDEHGHDLVQTSAHFGARPDHATWQGRVFSRSGAHGRYSDFVSSTGYGSVTGLAGVNCRHSHGPYFAGITELPKLPRRAENGMSNNELYAATQKQRRRERGIRGTKREIHALQVAGLDDVDARLKLGDQQRRLKAYVDDLGLPRLPHREKAYGINAQPRAFRVDPR